MQNSSLQQGQVRLWVEIYPSTVDVNLQPLWDCRPKPSEVFQLRVVVWGTKGIKSKDAEGVSDIFVRGFMDPQQEQNTDTHYRCATGAVCLFFFGFFKAF